MEERGPIWVVETQAFCGGETPQAGEAACPWSCKRGREVWGGQCWWRVARLARWEVGQAPSEGSTLRDPLLPVIHIPCMKLTPPGEEAAPPCKDRSGNVGPALFSVHVLSFTSPVRWGWAGFLPPFYL